MTYLKWAYALVAVSALGGCATYKPESVSQSALQPYQGERLTVVTYKKADFVAMTQTIAITSGLFGAIGGLAGASVAIDNGNKIVSDDNISDPALEISAKLAPQVRDLLKPSSENPLSSVDTKATDEKAISKLVGNDGVIFDVETLGWQFIYFPFSSHYRVVLSMRARLIDAHNGKRIAQAPCTYASDEKDAPTYDEMLADSGTRLKAMIAAGTDQCLGMMQKPLTE
jgi:hypothetical protein